MDAFGRRRRTWRQIARTWLLNRFALTFGGFALIVAVWNVYVAFNDDGVITGSVVGPEGAPVAEAVVTLSERTLLVARERDRAVTDAAGRFAFFGHDLHRLYLEAEKDGLGRAAPREVRLYFKGQNLELEAPLRLADGPSS